MKSTLFRVSICELMGIPYFNQVRITSLIFLFGFGISLSTFFCYERIKKKCKSKKCKDDKCIQCHEDDFEQESDDIYESLCRDSFVDRNVDTNNSTNHKYINYATFNIDYSTSLNISPIKNQFYNLSKTFNSYAPNIVTRSRFSLPDVWSFNNDNSQSEENLYDGINFELDDIPGFSTPDVNETGQTTEDSLQSLQHALNSLKQDIGCLGDDVMARSTDQRFDSDSSDSGCKSYSNLGNSSPKISTSDFYIDDDIIFDTKYIQKTSKVKNVAVVSPIMQMKLKEENWKVENISHQKNIFELLDENSELNNKDYRLHRMAYKDVQLCYGCEEVNIIRKDNYGLLRSILYKTIITNSLFPHLNLIQKVIDKIIKEEEDDYSIINNWHFANRLPYNANDIRSAQFDCLSLLIEQIKYINSLYKEHAIPKATSTPCSNCSEDIPEVVKHHFITFVNSNPNNDLKLLEAMKLIMMITSLDIHASNDKLNSSSYEIYSQIKSRSHHQIFTSIDRIGDTKDCDDLDLTLLADILHVKIVKVNIRSHHNNNNNTISNTISNTPDSQFLTKYNCSCIHLCEIILSINETHIIIFN